MYARFEAEMTFAGMTKKETAEEAGMKYDTLLSKLSGKTPLTFAEAMSLRSAIRSELSLEELFAK